MSPSNQAFRKIPFHVLLALPCWPHPCAVVKPQKVLALLCFASVWHPSSQVRDGGCAHSRPAGQTYILFCQNNFSDLYRNDCQLFLEQHSLAMMANTLVLAQKQSLKAQECLKWTKFQKHLSDTKRYRKQGWVKYQINCLSVCIWRPWISSGTPVSDLLI